uniref:Uncharacterized protein n=1 Tax=Chenopodium quinoa TaxID=63459 RepID=A0A803N341_CHEQI
MVKKRISKKSSDDAEGLHLPKLESQMIDLVDGGDEFKRCFVLHAMCNFLAPTTNRTVSLKLLKAVEEVDEIKTFDWCSYVLKKLKKVVDKYNIDETVQNGPLDTSTYLVSQPDIRKTIVKQPRTLGYDQGASTSDTTSRFVEFELPEGVMTNDEIKEISTYSNGFKTLSDMVSSGRTVSLSSDDDVAVSQTQQLLFDPHYLKLLDGLIDECIKMKYVPEMFRGFYEPGQGYKEDEPGQGFNKDITMDDENGNEKGVNEDVPINNDNKAVDEGVISAGPSGIIPGPTGNVPAGHTEIITSPTENVAASTEIVPARIIRADKSVCLLDCGENLVTFGMNFLIPREDMMSLATPLRIRWYVIDWYSLYLNEKACFESSGPRRLFFGVRKSFALVYVYDNTGKGDISSDVKDLHDIWEG